MLIVIALLLKSLAEGKRKQDEAITKSPSVGADFDGYIRVQLRPQTFTFFLL